MQIVDRIKAVVQKGGPSEAQKVTLVKMVSTVVWADGKLEDSERAEVGKLVEELSGLHPATVDQVLNSEKQLTEQLKAELTELPPHMAHQAMKMAFRVANADDDIADSELAVIRDIAQCVLPDKDWELVRQWIASQDMFLKATRKLFA